MFTVFVIILNAFSQADCDMFDYVPINSEHCPHVDYLANLKTCEKANDNELCFSKGICGLKTDLNNCLYPARDIHTYDIYVKHSKYRQLSYWEELGVSKDVVFLFLLTKLISELVVVLFRKSFRFTIGNHLFFRETLWLIAAPYGSRRPPDQV